MPVGVMINGSVVLIGGMIGAILKNRISNSLVKKLTTVFGLSAITISIVLINELENLAPVILAIILGTMIGELLKIEISVKDKINKSLKKAGESDQKKTEVLITVIALFCFSGTGIFGALNEGFTGNGSILIAKSVMDFFTAIIFGAYAGYFVALIALPQTLVGFICFYSASYIIPLVNTSMLNDFKACGGIITLAAGLKLAKILEINVINMLPSLFIVMILTYGWQLTGL